LEVPAALNSPARCLPPDWITQAILERSDGGAREGHRQQSPPAILLPDILTRATTGAAEVTGKSPLSQVLPTQSLPFPRISVSLFTFARQRSDQGALGTAVARQVAKEDTSAARAKDPNEKNDRSTSRRKLNTPTMAPPPNPTLIAHPSNELGRNSPTGEDTQGPLPMDYIAWSLRRNSKRKW